MTKDEALKLALEALDDLSHYADLCELFLKETHPGKAESLRKRVTNSIKAITAIKEALAQPEQEPVAWYVERQHVGFRDHGVKLGPFWKRADAEEWVDDKQILKPLYTTPPQRKPLTDEEIDEISKKHIAEGTRSFEVFARAIEAAHGIKGEA